VHVKMKYRLPGNFAIVGKDVESLKFKALNNCPCNHLCNVQNIVQVGFSNVKEIEAMRLGNDQGVTVVNRIDVQNRDHIVVLEENLGGELMTSYLTKNAIDGFTFSR